MTEYKGLKFHTCNDVYEPAEDTFLFADNLKVKCSDSVLEIGTGTGIIAILASQISSKTVVAVDINPQAIACAKKNVELNEVQVDLRRGNLFEPVKNEKFDLILFNTPYLPTGEDEIIDEEVGSAWDGGIDGRSVINPFIEGLTSHLNPMGRVQLVQSSLSDIEQTTMVLMELGFEVQITAKERYFFEEVVVITGQLRS